MHTPMTPMSEDEYAHMMATAPIDGGKVISLEGKALADVKALFAADGTFSVDPGGASA